MQIKNFLKDKNIVSPWLKLDQSIWEPLTANAPTELVKQGKTMLRRGESNTHVYIVKKGRFRLFFEDWDGNESCVYIAEEGCIMGEITVLDGKTNYASAYAIVDSLVYKIDSASFLETCSNNREISAYVMANLCRKIRLMNSEMEYFSKKAISRVAIALMAICNQYGKNIENGIEIGIKFTHEEVANLTGLNRVTVSKVYAKLAREGVLSKKDGRVIVSNIQYLMDII